MAFRSGFVSILGRPNAGKSTLLNALVGQKVAIVSPKPQTTRNRILGVLQVPSDQNRPAGQVILIDTPGVHKPDSSLGRTMMAEVRQALAGCDLLLLMADVSHRFGREDQFALEMAKHSGTPVLLLLNKIDRIPRKERLLPMIEEYRQRHEFREILPLSARKREGLDLLLATILQHLPEGPRYFPEDQITDQPLRFMVAESIREQVVEATSAEVPYATTVVIDEFEEGEKLTRVAATIHCEREGQKRILVGRHGQMLKKIGTAARSEIARLLGTRVYLELFVKVSPAWRDSRAFLQQLDWRRALVEGRHW
jgi:GTPase